MRAVATVVVNFRWDDEAGVYVAWSDDVPLATEADTFEDLRSKVLEMIPELLALNNMLPETDDGIPDVPVQLLSQYQVRAASA